MENNKKEEVLYPWGDRKEKPYVSVISTGDLRRLSIIVDATFEETDAMPLDWDEHGNVLEYGKGFILHVHLPKPMFYQGQPTIYLAHQSIKQDESGKREEGDKGE